MPYPSLLPRAGLMCLPPSPESTMVDVDTALRASAYSGKKGGGSKGEDRKDSTLEPFDPSSHAEKERADAISMWIVIVFGLLVASIMRYYVMPGLDETAQVLWLLPFLMIALIKPIHQVMVPSSFFEQYTTGNWVRASFLYLFTWLALSFALVNPPLADIAAPHLAGSIDVASQSEGITNWELSGKEYAIEISQESVPVILGFAVRDNVDSKNVTMDLIIRYKGEELLNETGLVSTLAAAGPSQTFESIESEDWLRGMKKNSLTNEFIGPKVAPHDEDIGMAWDLCGGGCSPGDYEIFIHLVEESEMIPWETGKNSWSAEYTLSIARTS